MSDHLRITTPVSNNETISKTKPNREPSIVQEVDPHLVSSKVNSEQAEGKNNPCMSWENGSVFNKFLTRLQQTPELSQILPKLLLGSLEQPLAYSGIPSNLQSLLEKLVEAVTMNEEQMLNHLLFQQEHRTKFSGELFQFIKQLAHENSSPELYKCIGRFLKAYDGFSSLTDTMNLVTIQLKDILRYLPKSYRQDIEQQMGNLTLLTSEKGLDANLKILKENILPLIGKYVAETNDFSQARDRIGILIHNISRLNISTADEFSGRFQELLDFCRFELNISSSKLSKMQQLFIRKVSGAEKEENTFIDTLLETLSCVSSKSISNSSKAMLGDTINTLLMDNSVFMPFNHIFLPVFYQGAFMFTDIWIEKNDEKEGSRVSEEEEKRLHLSFEIRGIGDFKATIVLKNKMVDFQLHYPQNLSHHDYEIRKEMSRIFVENGFDAQSIVTISKELDVDAEVMRKILERRSMIDVVV